MNPDFRQHKDFHDYVRGQVLSRRISLLSAITIFILVCYIIMFWYLQVVETNRYSALSEENRIRRILVRAPRGAILDRHGEILARNRLSFSILINREISREPADVLDALSGVLNTGEAEIRERYVHAAARLPRYEPILVAEDVPLAAVAWLEARRAEMPGVTIRAENLRYYEGGANGAHALGYVGEISSGELASGARPGAIKGDIVGKSGIERLLDTRLRGTNGYRRVVVNSVGREVGRLGTESRAVPGANVRTSIDGELQRTVDFAFGSFKGAAVFMDPWTGEILALSSRPGYDPNLFARRFTRSLWRSLVTDPRHPLQNRAVQSGYSPGSTFKPLVAVAGLQERVIAPETRIHCGGSAVFHGRRFHCHKRGGHGSVDLHEAIVKSCNIYFYTVADMLGIDTIARYARELGLGATTGIPTGMESPGLVPDSHWRAETTGGKWYPSETISVGIGQGPLLITPLQQAVMVSALATDGRRPVPTLTLLQGPEGDGGPVAGAVREGRPTNPKYLDVVRNALWGVVHEGGTGWRAKSLGYDVCGKTGTAQVVSASVDVKDQKDLPPEMRDHAWFVGFAPRDHPEIAFAVIVENGGHGGETAVPLVREALEAFFGHRPIRPGSAGAQESTEVASHDPVDNQGLL